MTEQLIFDLPVRHAMARDDFFVSPANEQAVLMLDQWQSWPLGKVVLSGPMGAGKSHLAQIWAENANGVIVSARDILTFDQVNMGAKNICVEDAHLIVGDAENTLFHIHNLVAQNECSLLITGQGTPQTWPMQLPDLVSRIAAAGHVKLDAPDDALLAAVMVKQFQDRQVAIDPRVITYLLPRMERSFADIAQLVSRLDETAMMSGKPISLKLAREVLDSSS